MTGQIADWIKEKAAEHAASITRQAQTGGDLETAEKVAAYFGIVYASVLAAMIAEPAAEPEEPVEEVVRPTSAQVRKSVTPDGIVSFLDGKSYKTLKRHLTGAGLTPAEYRTRFGLPADYPMVCANYSAARSALAKQTGLGQRGADASA